MVITEFIIIKLNIQDQK